MKFSYVPPPRRMWMVKTAHLAPYYGIAFRRRDLKPKPKDARYVRVVVFEARP